MSKKATKTKTNCAHCLEPFTTRRVDQVYCSKKCRCAAAKKRDRVKSGPKLRSYSRSYYRQNKSKWKGYKETQAERNEKDPARAEHVKEVRRDAEERYTKRHPGLKALRTEARRDRINPERRRRVPPGVGAKTLLAAARLLSAESKRSPEPKMAELYSERWILEQAAQVLTVRAGAVLLADRKGDEDGRQREQKTEGQTAQEGGT